jgi:hypothetical protein
MSNGYDGSGASGGQALGPVTNTNAQVNTDVSNSQTQVDTSAMEVTSDTNSGLVEEQDFISSLILDEEGIIQRRLEGETNVGAFNIYEDDGDSIMGALLPTPHIKRVTLETPSSDSSLVDREPHIKVDQLTAVSDSGSPETVSDVTSEINNAITGDGKKDVIVTVDLSLKLRIEEDDFELIKIMGLKNSLKLKVFASTNLELTQQIMGSPGPFFPQEAGFRLARKKYLDEGDFGYSTKFDGIENVAPLNEIGVIDLIFRQDFSPRVNLTLQSGKNQDTNIDQKMLIHNMDKETLADGTQIYNIPHKVTMSVPWSATAAYGNTIEMMNDDFREYSKLQHLTVFAITYIDFESLISEIGSEIIDLNGGGGPKADQFKEIGYNDNDFSTGQHLKDFGTLITDYGYSLSAINQVILNGNINNKNTKYVYRGVEEEYKAKKGLVWHGPVHYHGPNNPSPDGYQGLMGGTPEHMTDSSKPTPKLKEVTASGVGEIVDLRRRKQLEQFFFNYTSFGLGTSFDELTKPASSIMLDTQSADALYIKQTKSNDWLKAKTNPIASEAKFSTHSNGEVSVLFDLDIFNIIRYNTLFPGLITTATQAGSALAASLYSAEIKKLEVFKKEVTLLEGAQGKEITNNLDIAPTHLVSSHDGDKVGNVRLLKPTINKAAALTLGSVNQPTFSTVAGVSTAVSPPGFGPGSSSAIASPAGLVGAEADIEMITARIKQQFFIVESSPTSDASGLTQPYNKVRHYVVKDKTSNHNRTGAKTVGAGKRYRYGVNVEIKDPIHDFLIYRLNVVTNLLNELYKYYNFCTQNREFTNSYTNMFTKTFNQVWNFNLNFNTAPPPGDTFTQFKKSKLGLLITDFMQNVMMVLKPLPTTTASDTLDLMFSLTNPLTGSPSGVSSVIDFILTVEKGLRDLLKTSSSSNSVKSLTYGKDTLGEKLTSSGGKEPKNIIKLTIMLDGIYDTSVAGLEGYEYIFDEKILAEGTQWLTDDIPMSLSNIGMLKRLAFEKEKYGTPENAIGLASHLGPVSVSTERGKRFLEKTQIGITQQNSNLVDAMIDVLESKSEGLNALDLGDVYDTTDALKNIPITSFGSTGGIQSSKRRVPNMMNILSQDGVSINSIGSDLIAPYNLENPTISPVGTSIAGAGSYGSTPEPPGLIKNPLEEGGFKDSIANINAYKKSIVEAFGPSTAQDASWFLLTLMLMRQAGYLENIDSQTPKLTSFALASQIFAFGIQGLFGGTIELPKQMKKLFDMMGEDVPPSELNNLEAIKEYSKKFDNYANLANLVINYTTMIRVEYFAGYNTIVGPYGSNQNLKSPIFKLFTDEVYGTAITAGSTYSTYDPVLLLKVSPYDKAATFKINDSIKLPIYNEYFLLRLQGNQ